MNYTLLSEKNALIDEFNGDVQQINALRNQIVDYLEKAASAVMDEAIYAKMMQTNKEITDKLDEVRTLITKLKRKRQLEKIYNKYSKNKSDYVVSNWPIYDISKEIQKSNNIAEYINVSFENIQVMIFKNYDEILKTTFGDYMQLPPEDKRKSHGLEAYWRNDNEEKEC